MNVSFKGKKVLVTGASRGIGKDVATVLAKDGAIVYALARNEALLAELQREYPTIKTISVDLADWKATEKALENLEPLDYLVNNAAVSIKQPLGEITEETVDITYNVNVKSVINITQIVTNKMIAAGIRGSIVNVSSCAGLRPGRDTMVYHSSKAALEMLTKCFAKKLAPHRIRCSSINPTLIWTDMGEETLGDRLDEVLKLLPFKELPTVRHCTNAILYLLSDLSEMTTGTNIPVDAGNLIA